MKTYLKTSFIALKLFMVMTLFTGVLYPAAMTLFGQLVFPENAHGSLIKNSQNEILGSKLIAQKFTNPRYFYARPSGTDYNTMPSGGTNLAPTSATLMTQVKERIAAGSVEDLLFASASGLDPHISPKAAESQIGRVASARGMSEDKVRSMISTFTEGRQFRVLGEVRVNVLLLNLALDERQ